MTAAPRHPHRPHHPRHPHHPHCHPHCHPRRCRCRCRCRGAHGRSCGPSPSDIIFVLLSLAVLTLAAFTVGGLMARPF